MKRFLYCCLFLLLTINFLFIHISFGQTQPAPTIPSKAGVQPTSPSAPPTIPTPSTAGGEKCDPKKDIMLNMNIPFVGKCIKKDVTPQEANSSQGNSNVTNVFPKLMGGLIRIVMTAIYIIGFLGILVGGFMVAGSGVAGTKQKGMDLIKTIILGLILLGASGVILHLINPDFFGVDSI